MRAAGDRLRSKQIARCFVFATALVLQGAGTSARADVRLSNLFGDSMVLQRDLPVAVWGQADAGEKITVSFAGARAEAVADAAGNWSLKLPAFPESSDGRELTVAGKNTITIRNVAVGDVWVCSGQSNMEWGLGGCNARDDVAAADCPKLRRIKLDHRALGCPDRGVPGRWEVCTPQSAPGFTAVGFYFARRIQKETGVPIGLIDDNWGGTRIEPWIPPAGFEQEPTLVGMLEDLKKRDQDYRSNLGKGLDEMTKWIADTRAALAKPDAVISEPPRMPGNPLNDAGSPTTLYNGMIHPIMGYGIKGAIWYQGESNGGEGDEYFVKMRALIGGWRKLWAQPPSPGSGAQWGEFPFYFVQLANFQRPNDNPAGGDGWARIRMAQLKALQIPKTGMAVAIDLADAGNPDDIHPKNKFDVGERLALWALKSEYGKPVVASGPLYKGIKVEGSKIRVSFDYVGGGLMAGSKVERTPAAEVKDQPLKRFAVAGEDRKWVWADAAIDGADVLVSSPQVPAPVAVRYAYSMNPAGANLYNREGLPASPFRSDDW
jgi:sialate O-acetylesterase